MTPSEPSTPKIAKSPTYPQRAHLPERPRWQALLKSWDDRIAAATPRLASAGDDASRRTLGQLLGARDQIADAVRRLPMEVGSLYEDDRHRVEEAVAALERLFARLDANT